MLTLRTTLMALAGVLLVGAGAAAGHSVAPAPARPRTPVSAPMTGLHVSGNRLLNGSGTAVQLHGVNRSGPEYMCLSGGGVFDGPADQASVTAMKNWAITAVRIPLNEDCWLGINGVPAADSGITYTNAISSYVGLLAANNIAAILDLQWAAPGTTVSNQSAGNNGLEPFPDADHAPAFWTSVAQTFAASSTVVFDLFNEPYAPGGMTQSAAWACWKNGGSCAGVSYSVAGMQTLVNSVRATGATNPIMLGGLAYANDLSQWLQNEPNDNAGQLIASTHLYNFDACASASCWDSQLAPVARAVPLVAGELGENDCSGGFLTPAMDWLDAHGAGYLGWAWDTYDCTTFPALVTSYTGTPTVMGQFLRDRFLALAGLPYGPPAPTNTPTATNTPAALLTPPIGVNAGGAAYTAGDGTRYVAEAYSNGYGTAYTSNDTISGTSDPTLYQSGRAGQTFTYSLPVPNGTYTVTLGMASTSGNPIGAYGDDLYLQGSKVAYCVWSATSACQSTPFPGADVAASKSYAGIVVTNTVLTVSVQGSYGLVGVLSSIKVTGAPAPTATPTATPTNTPCPGTCPTATPTPITGTNTTFFTLPAVSYNGGVPPDPRWLNPQVVASSSSSAAYDAGHTAALSLQGGAYRSQAAPSSGAPVDLIYDISGITTTHSISLTYSAGFPNVWDDTAGSTNFVGLAGAIEVDTNTAAAGGVAPTTGWTTVSSVVSNTLSTVPFTLSNTTGVNWVRLRFTALATTDQLTTVQAQVDFYDATAPSANGVMFAGDSITLLSAGRGAPATTYAAAPSWFSPAMRGAVTPPNGAQPLSYYPWYWADGIGGTTSADLCTTAATARLSRDLAQDKSAFFIESMGMNDANTGGNTPSGYVANIDCARQAVEAAGKTLIVPLISWTSVPAYSANVYSLDSALVSYLQGHPDVLPGPNFYDYFYDRPYLLRDPTLSSGDVHPNGDGMAAIMRLWENWFLQNIYGSAYRYADPYCVAQTFSSCTPPTATPTAPPTATPTNTPGPTSTPTNTPGPTNTPTPGSSGCAAGWTCADVGSVPVAGSQTNTGGTTWTLNGTGDNYTSPDSFRFVYRTLTGDGSVVAEISGFNAGANQWAKAGLMLRTPGSSGADATQTYVAMDLTQGHGGQLDVRQTAGSTASSPTSGLSWGTPIWLKITRTGTAYSFYSSTDGTTWTAEGSSPYTYTGVGNGSNQVEIGLFETSGGTSTVSTSTFSNVALTGSIS